VGEELIRWRLATIVIDLRAGLGESRGMTICAVADDGGTDNRVAPNPYARQPKRRGEQAEAYLHHRAFGLGFNVCKPWGDSASFDFVLEWLGRMARVQVKSGWEVEPGRDRYMFNTTVLEDGDRVTYTKKHTDFLACVIPPLDLTYMVPVEALEPDQKYLQVVPFPKPDRRKRRETFRDYECYRERWDLLQ
jgi:hypothetical protein